MKLTVVIPTRNRARTLRYALSTCTAQSYKNMEIIVSDNCSEDDTETVVRSNNDSRVRYVRTPRRVSMTANFEFALSHVTEGFVGFIGDDDGLLPCAVEQAASYLTRTGLQALTSVLAFYRWPCAPEEIRNTGILQMSPKGDSQRESATFIESSLRGTGAFYIHDLPSLYYGFADIALARPTKGGQFFHSVTPDAYSAFAVAAQVKKFGYLAEPLFIVGASGRSNGVSNFQENANRDEASRFLQENDISFHQDYLLCGSIGVYMHEAFAQAAEQYPQLNRLVPSDPRELLRYVAREQNSRNRDQLLLAILHTAVRTGVDEGEARRIFGRKQNFTEKVIFSMSNSIKKALGRRPGSMGAAHVKSVEYRDMAAYGISNSMEASIFFEKEIRRRRIA